MKLSVEELNHLSKGNIGALSFLMELQSPSTPAITLEKIQLSGITGTDLYVLWADLCGRDMGNVIKLVDNCPLETLKDACSRQDYSGMGLISEYLNN